MIMLSNINCNTCMIKYVTQICNSNTITARWQTLVAAASRTLVSSRPQQQQQQQSLRSSASRYARPLAATRCGKSNDMFECSGLTCQDPTTAGPTLRPRREYQQQTTHMSLCQELHTTVFYHGHSPATVEDYPATNCCCCYVCQFVIKIQAIL